MAERPGMVSRDGEGVLLRAPGGERFRFDPGALCLEFAITGGEGERAVFETLLTPADLRAWMRDVLGSPVGPAGHADLAAAKRLREAIWQCALARTQSRGLPSDPVREINRAAADPPPAPRIDGLGRQGWQTPVAPSQVLSLFARDAVTLFTGPFAHRIRQCAGTNCSLLFADTSRSGRRRWCSMERCGNRAKVRAYRERRLGEAHDR